MKLASTILIVLAAVTTIPSAAQAPAQEEQKREIRYSVGLIDDATVYENLEVPGAAVRNHVLIEPNFALRYDQRWTFSTSLIGDTTTYTDSATQLHVREAYTGLSAGDFDFMVGRKLLRWGTGYGFTAAGVLDPPRVATDPGDRLNLNEGRDMAKAEWIHGPHAFTVAWSTAQLARSGTQIRDVSAFRYNVLVRGFDTALIAGHERGNSPFGGLTFTRVVGQAWEIHGETLWREQQAVLIGAKYTLRSGVSFLGELYTPPNTAYYEDHIPSSTSGRPYDVLFYASKSRLRELPGWKEWDVSGSIVSNLNDHSYTGVIDVSRWFGTHFSAYTHMEVPSGTKTSVYGAAPYATATSFGIRFQL